jgi:hypothetical protein
MKKLFVLLALLALIAFPASAQAAHSVTLTWTASTDSGVAYNVYRGSGICPTSGTTGLTKLGSVAVGTLTYTDSTVTPGAYCYYVTATLAGAESKPSNLVGPSILPGTVTVTVTVAQ